MLSQGVVLWKQPFSCYGNYHFRTVVASKMRRQVRSTSSCRKNVAGNLIYFFRKCQVMLLTYCSISMISLGLQNSAVEIYEIISNGLRVID